MDLDFVSVHKNGKRQLGQYPAILTSRLVNNIYFVNGLKFEAAGRPAQELIQLWKFTAINLAMLCRNVSTRITFIDFIPSIGTLSLPVKNAGNKKQNKRKIDHFLRHKTQTTTLDITLLSKRGTTYFQYLHLDIQRQQNFTYKPDQNAPISTHHPHYQLHRSSNYQSQYWSENHYIYLNFQPSLDSVNNQLPPTSWVFNAIFVSSDSLLSGISFFHNEVRVNCSIRSRWVVACNSHTKPISKHFYRLIYF